MDKDKSALEAILKRLTRSTIIEKCRVLSKDLDQGRLSNLDQAIDILVETIIKEEFEESSLNKKGFARLKDTLSSYIKGNPALKGKIKNILAH